MAEPYRNRGGVMPEKEYGAERQRAGWVKMAHPDLPDNDPILVVESAVPAKKAAGWLVVEFNDEMDSDGSSWETTNDGELTEDRD